MNRFLRKFGVLTTIIAGAFIPSLQAQEVGYPDATWDPSPNHYTTARHKNANDVNTVVMHTTEGSFASALSTLKDPNREASSHYIIRSSDGYIVQLVDEIYGAWHAGNGTINRESIGIEEEAFADDPSYFTYDLYTSAANLVRWTCNYWGIEKNRVNIIGHQEVPNPNNPDNWGGVSGHYDPGMYYGWDSLIQVVTGKAPHYQQLKIKATTLNVRTRPNGPLLTTVSEGQEFVSYYQDPASGWYLIFIPGGNGKHANGWISGSSSYVKPVACHNQVKVTGADALNIRNKDHSTVLDKMARNQRFVSISNENGWYEVYTPASTNDTSGWVSENYLMYPCDCTLPDPVIASGEGTYCDSTELTASGGNGGTIFWQGTTRDGAKKDTPTAKQVVTKSGTYYFRAYNDCGWGEEDSVEVVINHSPKDALTISIKNSFCDSTQLKVVGGQDGTVYWQGTTRDGTSMDHPTNHQTVTSSGVYYFRTHNDCGWGQQDSIEIIVTNDVPNPVTVSGGGTFCDTTFIYAAGGESGNIYWQGKTSNGTSLDHPIDSQIIRTSGTYYFRAYNDCGWGEEDSVEVEITHLDAEVTLQGDSLVSNIGEATFQWITYPSMEPINGAIHSSFSPTENGKYALIINKEGCIDTSAYYNVTNIWVSSDLNDQEIIAYPNPVSSSDPTLFLKGKKIPNGTYHIHIFNELGQTLSTYSFEITNQTLDEKLDINHFSGTVLFLKIKSNDFTQKIKIIKQ